MATSYYNSNIQPIKPKIPLLVFRRCSREQDTHPGLLGVPAKSQSGKSGNYLSPEKGDPGGGPRWDVCEWPVHSAHVNGRDFPSWTDRSGLMYNSFLESSALYALLILKVIQKTEISSRPLTSFFSLLKFWTGCCCVWPDCATDGAPWSPRTSVPSSTHSHRSNRRRRLYPHSEAAESDAYHGQGHKASEPQSLSEPGLSVKDMPLTTVFYSSHESLLTERKETKQTEPLEKHHGRSYHAKKKHVSIPKGKLQWCPRSPKGHGAVPAVFT